MESSYVLKERGVTNSAFVMDDVQCTQENVPSKSSSAYGKQDNEEEEQVTIPEVQCLASTKRFFINPKGLLVSLCFASLIQGIIVNGFVNVVISTLEKRFHLSSRETGVIASSYDVGSMLCVVPLSYLGGRLGSSKPKYISLGLVLMGLGSFIFSLPHFVSGRYLDDYIQYLSVNNSITLNNSNHQVCFVSEAEETESQCKQPLDLSNFKYLLIFGQILHGIGASPLVTLGNTLIDESVGSKLAPLYIGIFSTFFVIGPAVGFVVGGQLLNIYTDFYEISIEEIAQIPKALWVGSWWLGFVILGVVSIFCALLVGQFPSVLSEAKPEDGKQSNEFTTLKELPKALKALLVNPTYMLLSIGGAIDGFWLSSITAFLPKYLESQYFLSSAGAATLVGIVAVPSGGLGTFMGGWITKKLKLTRGGVIKLYLICQFIGIPFGFAFMLSCQNPDFAGISVPYNISSKDLSLSINVPCNANCSCSPSKYNPVCGSDGVLYYSPCYAGCRSQLNSTSFENCDCIPHEQKASKSLESCNYECNYMIPFIVIIGFNIFITFMASMTTIFATLRAVEPVHKSLSLGLSAIILRVIGSIPGPMIFGAVIDMGCQLWKPSVCKEEGGNCLIYKNMTMSVSIMIFFFVFKVLGILSYSAALFFSGKSKIGEPDKAR